MIMITVIIHKNILPMTNISKPAKGTSLSKEETLGLLYDTDINK